LRGVAGLDKNVYDTVKDYSKPVGHNNYNPPDVMESVLEADSNVHRWISNTPYTAKFTEPSNIIEWQMGRDNRPVNDHYNGEKGFKFDVPVPYAERIPHVADRLGYAEQIGTPFERLFHLEHDLMHPQYLDQPFVQTPAPNPDSSLNFSEGEVVYENVRVLEWSRAFLYSGWTLGTITGFYVPFHLLTKTSIPSSSMKEGLPGTPYFELALCNTDTYNAIGIFAVPIFGFSMATWVSMLGDTVEKYAVKCQYNVDSELLFVWFCDKLGNEIEKVYEMEHLEIAPPSVKGGLQYLSYQDDDGLFMITDMNKGDNFYLYKEHVYWNPALRKLFMERITRLWDQSAWDSHYSNVARPDLDKSVLAIE